MVEVNSSQIFMVLFMSLLIRRDCISVSCVNAVKKKKPHIVPELHFFFARVGTSGKGYCLKERLFLWG